MKDFARYGDDVANTWKLRTTIFVLLACITPIWYVTAPIFLVFAWLSYKAGGPAVAAMPKAAPVRTAGVMPMSKAAPVRAAGVMPMSKAAPVRTAGVMPTFKAAPAAARGSVLERLIGRWWKLPLLARIVLFVPAMMLAFVVALIVETIKANSGESAKKDWEDWLDKCEEEEREKESRILGRGACGYDYDEATYGY